jgi:uncharacterized protein YdcH (DUF465 family)
MDDQRIEEIAVEDAIEVLRSEDAAFARVYEPHQSTRAALRAGIAALSAQEEELRSLREERDALKAQLQGVGIVPYLERMKELDARDEERKKRVDADRLNDESLVLAINQRNAAEAELQRLKDGMRGLDVYQVEELEGELVRVADINALLASLIEEKVT